MERKFQKKYFKDLNTFGLLYLAEIIVINLIYIGYLSHLYRQETGLFNYWKCMVISSALMLFAILHFIVSRKYLKFLL